jgi:hypothetical protein
VIPSAQPPRRRALLVGINEYPDPSDRLEGCVNDVFLMSSLLQESGYAAPDRRSSSRLASRRMPTKIRL